MSAADSRPHQHGGRNVLSIGKLGPQHWAYYEQSVADGREDYYAGAGEDQGRYIGRGAADLDLGGEIAEGDLKHLFAGTHPDGRGRWLDRQHQDKLKPRTVKLPDGREITGPAPIPTAAFDLTFSAPKSVSVLWALSPADVASEIKQAHEAAVAQAFDYLERTVCITRRGRGGSRHLRGDGFVGIAFNHRSSRAGDPQLHTHVLVANATRADGRFTALHGAALYKEAKTASYLYQAALRAELTRRIGVNWHRDPTSPHPEIEGIDRALRQQFSKRADEIAEQIAAAGTHGARARNAAAIDTRVAKDYAVNGFELKYHWRQEAATVDVPDPLKAIGRAPVDAPNEARLTRTALTIGDQVVDPGGLTRERSTFERRDVIQLAADSLLQGASVAEIEHLADTAIDLADDRMVLLDGTRTPQPDRAPMRVDDTPQPDARADRPFTTRELLEHEHLILDNMRDRAAEGTAKVPTADAARVLDARTADRQLAPEQRTMVESITTSGDGMQAVVGLAGAGKTYSLEAAHDIWRDHGIEVRGCSTALHAAKNLEAETAIPSETIAQIKTWAAVAADTGDTQALDQAIPKGGVLIVDEAGMVCTRDMSFLVDQCQQRGTKIILVGDHHQLPEIGAGGAFGGIVHRFEDDRGIDRLTTNRRQRADWEREALAQARAGSLEHAIGNYVANDRITVDADPERLRRALAADWLQARETNRQVAMIAYTNREVEALNSHVRRLLDERGELGDKRVTIASREWAAGDELLCLQNNRALGLTNGTRGQVIDVSDRELTIDTTNGKRLTVPRDYLERGHATYGWATTGHKAQGLTINGEAFVLASDHLSREWLYVAMSRATDASRIYIDTIDHDPRTGQPLTPTEQYEAAVVELHALASRSAAKNLAADLEPEPEGQLASRDTKRLSQRGDLPEPHVADFARGQEERSDRLRVQLVASPPDYLIEAIGPVPINRDARRRWQRDAVRLEQHRRRIGLSETEMTLQRADRVLGRRRRDRGLGREL